MKISSETLMPALLAPTPLNFELNRRSDLSMRETVVWVMMAGMAFHLAYWSPVGSWLIGLYLFALAQLSQVASWRRAFYSGLIVGFIIALGRLDFFWQIFSFGAIALWFVYAVWLGLFEVLAWLCFRQLSRKWAWVFLPFLWCGLEYFRSELYYLRFSWLTPGLAFGLNADHMPFAWLGSYGLGFILMSFASGAAFLWQYSRQGACLSLLAATIGLWAWGSLEPSERKPNPPRQLQIAGVQLEFPTEKQVCIWLQELIRKYPEAELLVLSEYTFAGPVPESVKIWCRQHNRHLIVGAKEAASNSAFFNTAFVISPAGEVVFRQAKAVPIQFFNDGAPATEQLVWPSPWGGIGLCICYDLSYTRVTDRLIRQGAQALIVPTMDVADWGKRQHELHARIAPVRAAEYQIPIFRLASSGISQALDSTGRVLASAPYPGQGAMISATFNLAPPSRLPLDRWLAPWAGVLSGGIVLILIAQAVAARVRPKRLVQLKIR